MRASPGVVGCGESLITITGLGEWLYLQQIVSLLLHDYAKGMVSFPSPCCGEQWGISGLHMVVIAVCYNIPKASMHIVIHVSFVMTVHRSRPIFIRPRA
jgi:hypothetical protein